MESMVHTLNLGCKKEVVRIITGSKNKDSCYYLFRKLNIPTLQSQYIFFIIMFCYHEQGSGQVKL
jgi:hypothetical protein